MLVHSLITASTRERDRIVNKGIIDFYLDLDIPGIGLLDFDLASLATKAGYEAAAPRIESWLQRKEKDSRSSD